MTQVFRSSSAACLGALSWNWIRSRVSGTPTVLHMGCGCVLTWDGALTCSTTVPAPPATSAKWVEVGSQKNITRILNNSQDF